MRTRKILEIAALSVILIAASLGLGIEFRRLSTMTVQAQSQPQPTIMPVRIYTTFPLVPISSTAAAGSAAVLTIPAPVNAAYFNYVCYLAIEGSNNNTPLAATNVVTTSTNFNSFAAKFSTPGAASSDTGVLILLSGTAPGCAKSAAAATATTFTSPTSTDEAYNWMALYFQGP